MLPRLTTLNSIKLRITFNSIKLRLTTRQPRCKLTRTSTIKARRKLHRRLTMMNMANSRHCPPTWTLRGCTDDEETDLTLLKQTRMGEVWIDVMRWFEWRTGA